MAVNVKQLQENRVEILTKARKINDDHSDKDGILPPEYQGQYDAAMKEFAVKGDEIKAAQAVLDRIARLENAEASLNQIAHNTSKRQSAVDPTTPVPNGSGNVAATMISVRTNSFDAHGRPVYADKPIGQRGEASYRDAFSRALGGGSAALTGDEMAALQSDDADQAGYLVASEQFATELLKEVDDLVFVRQHARIHTVREADSLGIRKRTAKAGTFAWSSELVVSPADGTLAFGKKVLTPHPATGEILVSRDLLRRAVLSVDGIVKEELSRDGGELLENAYLTGSGSQQPLGVFTASSDGISTSRDVLTGSATTFTADQLVAAKYTLKQQYRNGGTRSGARWLFHRDGISKVSQLKDGENHYMLQPARGLTGDEWDTLLGYPVDESEFAPNTFTTGLYVGLLANWRYYEIADALDQEIQVLMELHARTNQVGYIARLKTDGMPTLEEAFVRLKTN